jgi:hypothetical protein
VPRSSGVCGGRALHPMHVLYPRHPLPAFSPVDDWERGQALASIGPGLAFCSVGAFLCHTHMIIPKETWQQARDAVVLGASLQDVADSYGINYGTLKDRARREAWPRPDKLPPPPAALSAPVVASRSLAQRGETHRALIADMVERALQQAAIAPPALESWSDIATAAKLGDKALGLDKPEGSMISINFPAGASTESPGYIDLSTNFPPMTTMDPPPPEGTPLSLPEAPAP